jgi:hypothetical protein
VRGKGKEKYVVQQMHVSDIMSSGPGDKSLILGDTGELNSKCNTKLGESKCQLDHLPIKGGNLVAHSLMWVKENSG